MSHDPDQNPADLVEAARAAELELIAAEAKAEKRLQSALERLEQEEKKLSKAHKRVERRRGELVQAEEALRAAKDARATGIPTEAGTHPGEDQRRPSRDDMLA